MVLTGQVIWKILFLPRLVLYHSLSESNYFFFPMDWFKMSLSISVRLAPAPLVWNSRYIVEDKTQVKLIKADQAMAHGGKNKDDKWNHNRHTGKGNFKIKQEIITQSDCEGEIMTNPLP